MKEEVGIITTNEEAITNYYKFKKVLYLSTKRIFDIIGALIGLILLIPIAVMIKIAYMVSGDFHSILFTQERIGKSGKNFKFYKFRSMVPNADQILFEALEKDKKLREEYNLNKKLKDDPRITKVGKIIRKFSLDETPQFINIFLGDMSLIGNRPYLPRETEDMGKYFDDIVKTKPGLTGLWQVSGRSNVSFLQRLKLEQEYSKKAGFKMDIKIFFKTFQVVFFGKDAK